MSRLRPSLCRAPAALRSPGAYLVQGEVAGLGGHLGEALHGLDRQVGVGGAGGRRLAPRECLVWRRAR